ncbi:MAG: GH3 auxin-responsive promoter family protein [Planctomycetota bacterium]
MRRPVLLRALNEAYRLHLRPAWLRFAAAARDPAAAQAARLSAVLAGAAGTAFAREHGLSRVRTLADWQAAVPIRDYDELAPWIERVVRGEPLVLTREPPVVFEKSSGSTRASKYVPYPRAFLAEFGRATGPWLYDLLSRRPALRGGSSYWSISPVGSGPRERTPGGVPVGFEDDTEYFPRPVRRLLRALLPVPSAVARLERVEDCRYVTLRYLLADERLSFVSVWSPSFLTLLLEHARRHADRLADDLARGALRPPGGRLSAGFGDLSPPDPRRAALVREAFPPAGPLRLERVWPRLRLVSCWCDAAAQAQVPALRALLPPAVELQPKGLLATEGVVSFPLLDRPGAVLAVDAHVLELQPADDPSARPLPPALAREGARYLPILSTSGGLYRYRLGDVVEVVGRYEATPLVRFVERADGVSDLAGEKLSPGRVGEALAAACAEVGARPDFALLAPRAGTPPGYRLFVDAALEPALRARLAAALETRLREGHHYDLCRRLEQLAPLDTAPVACGWARYERALVSRGMRAGDVKPACLRREPWWDEALAPEAPA